MPPPLRAFGVAFLSALAGASVVHNYYAPDLSIRIRRRRRVLPPKEEEEEEKEEEEKEESKEDDPTESSSKAEKWGGLTNSFRTLKVARENERARWTNEWDQRGRDDTSHDWGRRWDDQSG